MKVKELIELLSKQDPEKEVVIKQGVELDYMVAYSVKEMNMFHYDVAPEIGLSQVVAIEYN